MIGEYFKWTQSVWTWIRGKLGFVLMFVSPMVFLWSLVMSNLDTILAGLDEANSTLTDVATNASANSALPAVATVWNIARYFAPVELCLYFMGALLYLKVICSIIRIVKSVIPTIG